MIEIYGASDDLIEIDGDISDEFTYLGERGHPNSGDGDLLAFSDGTILRITYTTGMEPIPPSQMTNSSGCPICTAPQDYEPCVVLLHHTRVGPAGGNSPVC